MQEGLVRRLIPPVDTPDRVHVQGTVPAPGREDAGIEGPDDVPVPDEKGDRVRRDVGDDDVGAVLQDGEVRDAEFLGAGLV